MSPVLNPDNVAQTLTPLPGINGALELDMINAQSYCHVMHYAKSVMVGPCT